MISNADDSLSSLPCLHSRPTFMPLMPSVFRNWFGGSSSQQHSATGSAPSSKSHNRSGSLPTPHIYAPPPSQAGSTSSLPRSAPPNMQRSYSYSNTPHTNPSPLRYATGTEPKTDTRTAYGYGRRAPSSSHSSHGHGSHTPRTPAAAPPPEPHSQPRPSVLRRTSHSPRQDAAHGKLIHFFIF